MTNIIKPYDPEWKVEFEKIKHILSTKLKDLEIDIQHVGSTSIPELYAKSILDIDIIIKDKNQLSYISEILQGLGYKNKGEQGILDALRLDNRLI